MFSRIKKWLCGERLAQNAAGWRLARFEKGLIIWPPRNGLSFFQPLAPFLVGVTIAVYRFHEKIGKLEEILFALPVVLMTGIWFFRRAALYVNRRKRIVMLGNFRRFAFEEATFTVGAFAVATSGKPSVLLVTTKSSELEVVWEAVNEKEAREICGLLSSELRQGRP